MTSVATVSPTQLVGLKNILYPTDFSGPSVAALPFAEALARGHGATIHAVHVLATSAFTAATPDLTGLALEKEREIAFASMGELETRLAGLPHEIVLERAFSVWQGINQVISESSIDLIVMGTHGRTSAQRFLLGSVAEEIFRRSRVPVLTVGPRVRSSPDDGGRFHRILFATDYSPSSATAAPYALSLAENTGAKLLLIHVAQLKKSSEGDRERERSEEEMIQKLYGALPRQPHLPTPPELLVEYGKPAERIVEVAHHREVDLIVLGIRCARGHIDAATHVERSVVHEIVAHACCPVLTVREA